MSLKASNKIDTNRYELEVQVDAETFEKAVNDTYLKERKKISLPGFRKGKVPRAMMEKFYGESTFYEGAVNALYPDALDAAIKEAQLEVIEDKIDFDLKEIGKQGFTFTAAVTTKPEVEIEDYKGLQITKKSEEVTDEDIDAEIAKVQERNSRLVSVEDRAAENGDVAVIDFEGFIDGAAFEGGKGVGYSLTLGNGQFIPGFEDQIVGHNVEDEFNVVVTFPEDYHAEELKGKEATFKVKLHDIKKKELPKVDDEFVKDVSEFDTLDDYKADLREKLEKKRKDEVEDDLENQLIDQLIERMKAEIPNAMYENKITEDIREFSYRLQSQGLNIQSYLQYTGMDMESFRGGFRPQAERQVKIRLALEKIAKMENIVPTDEEIEEEYKDMAEEYRLDVDKVKAIIPESELVKDISVEKALDIVRDNAKIQS